MKPSRNSDLTDHSLINNTKSINRKSVCAFDIKAYPRIRKNSNIYKMLKYGPLPDGDYKYLIKDGKITKYARWLLFSTDIGLSFLELCLLVKIMGMYASFKKGGILCYVLREWIFGQFCLDFDHGTIRNSLTRLKNKNYIIITPLRSVSCTDDKVQEIQDFMGEDFGLLCDYIEERMPNDLLLPAC